MITISYATWTLVESMLAVYTPFGGWLGSDAEEGRAKLRNHFG